MTSDLLGKFPIELNYPFNSDLTINQFKGDDALLTIWNDGCKVVKGDVEKNYYCINQSGPVIDYFHELAKHTNSIRTVTHFFESGVSINANKLLPTFLALKNDLDFTNVDHQLFYTIMQMTINEDLFQSIKM